MATIQLADYVLFAFNVSDRSTLPGYPPSPLLTRLPSLLSLPSPHPASQQDYKVIATASPSRAFQKLLGNVLATACIPSNFFFVSNNFCILSSFQFSIRNQSSFQWLNWPCFHISQSFSRQFIEFL